MTHGATAATVPRDGATPPLVFAHRGAWDQAPQNSLAAIRRAAALGCDGVEIDVRRTADGRLVVVHDGRLGWRPVRRLEHREVQARRAADHGLAVWVWTVNDDHALQTLSADPRVAALITDVPARAVAVSHGTRTT